MHLFRRRCHDSSEGRLSLDAAEDPRCHRIPWRDDGTEGIGDGGASRGATQQNVNSNYGQARRQSNGGSGTIRSSQK